MMNKIVAVVILSCFLFDNSFGQQYFQQDVKYVINVSLDDVHHELNANETIDYTNNSPAVLSFIYFHLWPNAYKDNATALCKQLVENGKTNLYFADAEERGFIDQLDFKIDGEPIKTEQDSSNIDIMKLILNKPLKHGEKIRISTPFHVKIPSAKFSRFGHLEQSYMISQWYPKPAVYDRNGWNQMPYLDQGEFYSEYGSFDVNITLPKNYLVGATGDLVDGEQEEKWMTKLADSSKNVRDHGVIIINSLSDKETKTLHYHQEKVHDFAWFANKNYLVAKGEVTLPHSNKKVTTWALYTQFFAPFWKKSIPYIDSAIYYYSLWNGDYPYHQCTAVDGTLAAGGGMEYPNVTVIGSVSGDQELENVIVHEVGHNWFYGVLGSNERKHAWMDEGINTFTENRYLNIAHPQNAEGVNAEEINAWGKLLGLSQFDEQSLAYTAYLFAARRNLSQPIDLPADVYTEINYGSMVYMKTGLVFRYLQGYLGEKTFDECMKQYFETWKFKHPIPEDVRNVFEKTSGKDLSWFFIDLIKTDKKIDYKICHEKISKNDKEKLVIRIKNNGDIKAPLSISAIINDSIVKTVWHDGFSGKETFDFPNGNYDRIIIDAEEIIPEINRKNNTIRTHGIFRKCNPFKLKFLASIENPERNQLYWTPVVGWNNYNKWMPGLALYNVIIPAKNFEYAIVPMYGVATKSLTGTGFMQYTWYPDGNVFQNITLGSSAKSYAYMNDYSIDEQTFHDFKFVKIEPELSVELKKKNARSPITRRFTIKERNIRKDYLSYNMTDSSFHQQALKYSIFNFSYDMTNKRTFDPYLFNLNLETGKGYSKVSGSFNYSISYNRKGTSADVRFFAGKFLNYNPNAKVDSRFSLSAINGSQDYLFDRTYLGRSEYDGFLSRQMSMRDGDFKVASYAGQTDNWLATMNADVPLFGAIRFIHLFFDLGTYRYSNAIFNPLNSVSYDAGFSVNLIKKFAVIYFPMYYSDDIKTVLTINNKNNFKDRIRFELNLDLLNPFSIIKNITF